MTGALRAFSDVSADSSLLSDGSDLLQKKSQVTTPSDEYSWENVTSVLLQHIPQHFATQSDVLKALRQFQHTVTDLGRYRL